MSISLAFTNSATPTRADSASASRRAGRARCWRHTSRTPTCASTTRRRPEVWDAILRAYRDAVLRKHTTLADFDRLYFGVGAQNYVWNQARFQEMVRRVYDAQGLNFLRAVREAFAAGDAGPLTPEETLERFEKIYPGFKVWTRRSPAG